MLLFYSHIALSQENLQLRRHGFDRTLIIFGKKSGSDLSSSAQAAAPGDSPGVAALSPRYVSRESIENIAQLSAVERVFRVLSNYSRLDLAGRAEDVRILMIDLDFAQSFSLGDPLYLERGLALANAPEEWLGGAGELRIPEKVFSENPNLPEQAMTLLRNSPPIPVHVNAQRYAPLPGGVSGEILAYASRTSIDMPQFMQPATIYVVKLRSAEHLSANLMQIRAILDQERVPGEMIPEAQLMRDYFPRPLLSDGLQWLDKAPAVILLVCVWLLAATEALVRFRVCSLEIALRIIAGRSKSSAILQTYQAIFLRLMVSLLLGTGLLMGLGLYFNDLAFAMLLAFAGFAGFLIAALTCYLLGRLQAGQSPLAMVASNHE